MKSDILIKPRCDVGCGNLYEFIVRSSYHLLVVNMTNSSMIESEKFYDKIKFAAYRQTKLVQIYAFPQHLLDQTYGFLLAMHSKYFSFDYH